MELTFIRADEIEGVHRKDSEILKAMNADRIKFYLTIDSAYELVWRLLREMRIYREGDKIEAELDGSFLISAKLKQQIEAD